MKVLQLTAHFSPNLGGVETHLTDLINKLSNLGHQVFVLTYRPLSVRSTWKVWERSKQVNILRLPWLPGLFNILSSIPAGEFLYLVPGLFVALPVLIILFKPNVIHAHGLSAGFVGMFWGRLFNVRVVVSTHSIYHFPSHGIYRQVARLIFSQADYSLCLSNQSVNELLSLGIPQHKVGRFTYWVDLTKFTPIPEAKAKLDWAHKFIVLFVGRLVPEKGIPELLKAAELLESGISLKIAGSGPLESQIGEYYIGRISQSDLPLYYSAADIVIVPSTHEEGFGRVIIESLACGTPVVAANRGAIPEAMDETVGKLIPITPQTISSEINYLFTHNNDLMKLSANARKFAVSRYSAKNIGQITSAYG